MTTKINKYKIYNDRNIELNKVTFYFYEGINYNDY